ncbi:hypothetical protein KFK09_027720 [Dendrobium nobile]|uniref:PORR domain-containing protein n=1 Tax=Dendrobium nobile TaxID=94219 RepID=A0A8T3A153_DENNO|nr:hypothetical protein KFK09_027720 [Dendrobium nobile]
MLVLLRIPFAFLNESISFGHFNCYIQKRWKKPVNSAQTRLENRARDLQFDKLVRQIKKLKLILRLHELMSQRRASHTSVQLVSRWSNVVGLNVGVGSFIQKHPRIFEVYTHPVKRNLCCRYSQEMLGLIAEEAMVIRESEMVAVQRLKKLLMMSRTGRLNAHALWLVRTEFGLPDNFRASIINKYPETFRLVLPDTVELVDQDDSLPAAEVEKWRESEYKEKWLSEYETRYAFPIQFPTGFKIEKGYREKLKTWQRLPYLKPYNPSEANCIRTSGGIERFEKRAVGILHEFLSLTVENMVDIERLSHFRRDFNMTANLRELLLKHPGIFYISTKGKSLTVFLREKYAKGCLLEPNPVYLVRRKMLDLVLLQCRFTNREQPLEELNL